MKQIWDRFYTPSFYVHLAHQKLISFPFSRFVTTVYYETNHNIYSIVCRHTHIQRCEGTKKYKYDKIKHFLSCHSPYLCRYKRNHIHTKHLGFGALMWKVKNSFIFHLGSIFVVAIIIRILMSNCYSNLTWMIWIADAERTKRKRKKIYTQVEAAYTLWIFDLISWIKIECSHCSNILF